MGAEEEKEETIRVDGLFGDMSAELEVRGVCPWIGQPMGSWIGVWVGYRYNGL